MKRLTARIVCLALFSVAASLPAQSPAELRAARAYDAAAKAGPPALHAFLDQFPKGADLHVHLSGAVYAETFIKDAAADGLCVDAKALSFAKPPCAAPLVPATELNGVLTPAAQDLYDRLIDSFSMRSYVPTAGFSGHDQFFATFAKFHGLSNKHIGEWVDEVAGRAAAQNQQYIELMETPPFSHAAYMASQNPLNQNPFNVDFASYRHTLEALMISDEVFAGREDVRAAEALRKDIEHCGTPQATPACAVQVRYIYQVLRGNSPEQVFAQSLLGFMTVQAAMDAHDDTWVGINLVMPEDGFLSMRDYTLQMKMLEYLHSVYPQVHITLHAGELAPGLVPPEGLRFHIRQAVELGHAERIGHGVDVMYEDNAQALLKEMAQKHIMVEINLSSNEGILGIKGNRHPFPLYRAAHVPVALSTDDEGVSRIELTHEYVRAALDYHLTYADLKQLARTGMEHNFLPGASLWAAPDVFTAAAAPCRAQVLGSDHPTPMCMNFLDGSQKAAAQWEQERRFRAFEAQF
ncbi:MAG TPA: adenosine deaminase [Terracidiphilus sp.]|jgi:adenosine deaminase|nr:adenosine deaminase [Terracidiphilus sp.]